MRLYNIFIFVDLVIWIAWSLPLAGKKAAPDVFGNSWVQWGCAGVVAVSVPIAVLLGLQLMAQGFRRKRVFFIACFACVPLVINLAIWGLGGPVMARMQSAIRNSHSGEADLIAAFTHRLTKEESVETRRKLAGMLYQMFGVRPVWRNEQSQWEEFRPSPEDEEKREDSKTISRQDKWGIETLDNQLAQLPWLFGLNLGAFVVVVFSGLAWGAFAKRPAGPALGRPPEGGTPT